MKDDMREVGLVKGGEKNESAACRPGLSCAGGYVSGAAGIYKA